MMSFTSRSCRPEVFFKNGILSNFLGVLRNHLYQSLFLTKLQACNFIKKETLAQVFSCEFCEISRNTFPTEHLCWPFLHFAECLEKDDLQKQQTKLFLTQY